MHPVAVRIDSTPTTWLSCADECRFSIAHIHKADLASKATAFRDLRQQLMTLLIQAVADKADSTNAVLAQLTLTVQKLAPAHWPIPKLIGKGKTFAWVAIDHEQPETILAMPHYLGESLQRQPVCRAHTRLLLNALCMKQ